MSSRHALMVATFVDSNLLNPMETFHDCKVNSEYHDVYDMFHSKTDLLLAKENWFNENLPRITQALRRTRDGEETFSVLSVGCGRGEVDMMMLPLLLQNLSSEERIEYIAVDPGGLALQEFTRKVKESVQLQTVCLRNHEMTFQEYCTATSNEQNCFDLIHFISSLYYCEAEETLVHCYEKKLKKNGAILCVVQEEGSQVLNLYKLYHGKNRIDGDNFIFHTADELALVANKHGWKYERSKYEFTVDFTEYFSETSEVGNDMLGLFLNVKDIRSAAGLESAQKINDVLEACTVKDADSRRILHGVSGIIIIYK